MLQKFSAQKQDELGVRLHVSPAKTLRFLKHSEEPFKAGSLHPRWGAASRASHNVDRASDTNRERHLKFSGVIGEKVFLSRRTHRYQEDLRRGRANR